MGERAKCVIFSHPFCILGPKSNSWCQTYPQHLNPRNPFGSTKTLNCDISSLILRISKCVNNFYIISKSQWKSNLIGRSSASPHIKTYCRISPQNDKAAWFLVTRWVSLEFCVKKKYKLSIFQRQFQQQVSSSSKFKEGLSFWIMICYNWSSYIVLNQDLVLLCNPYHVLYIRI